MAHMHDTKKAKYYNSPTKEQMGKTSEKNKNKATLGPGAEGNEFSDAEWAPSSRYKEDNHMHKMGGYKRPKKKSMDYSRSGGGSGGSY